MYLRRRKNRWKPKNKSKDSKGIKKNPKEELGNNSSTSSIEDKKTTKKDPKYNIGKKINQEINRSSNPRAENSTGNKKMNRTRKDPQNSMASPINRDKEGTIRMNSQGTTEIIE